jgi:hypothetical protein
MKWIPAGTKLNFLSIFHGGGQNYIFILQKDRDITKESYRMQNNNMHGIMFDTRIWKGLDISPSQVVFCHCNFVHFIDTLIDSHCI